MMIILSYALLYKGMIDGIVSLSGYKMVTSFRKNANSGDFEFIVTAMCSVSYKHITSI